MTARMFLIGEGVSYSLSPPMWNHVFARTGTDAEYGLRDVPAEGLDAVLEEILAGGILAANVTIPHKEWAATVAPERTSIVATTGAANLLRLRGGVLHAANTDVVGAASLLELRGSFPRVAIVGAGGTAAAMLEALVGVTGEVVVFNRTRSRAVSLVDRYAGRFASASAAGLEDLGSALPGFDLVVSTVPFVETAPFDPSMLARGSALFDLVYRRRPTALQAAAAGAGVVMCDGLAQLAAQAIAMLPLLDLDLGPDAPALLVEGLERAAGRPVRAWGEPLAG